MCVCVHERACACVCDTNCQCRFLWFGFSTLFFSNLLSMIQICQKSGEISLLKQQLRDRQTDVNHKLNEIVSLKSALKESKSRIEALERHSSEDKDRIHSRTVEVEVSLFQCFLLLESCVHVLALMTQTLTTNLCMKCTMW